MTHFIRTNQIYFYYLFTLMVVGAVEFRIQDLEGEAFNIQTFTTLGLVFIIIGLFHHFGEPLIVTQQKLNDQPKRQFIFEISLFTLIATSLIGIEIFLQNHSYIYASKLVSVVMAVGYFASMDNALSRERQCYEAQRYTLNKLHHTTPVSYRFSLFLTITLLVVLLVNAISAYSYMTLNMLNSQLDVNELKYAYITETVFTLFIVIALTLRLIKTYSLNLQHLFDTQVDILSDIQKGNLENFVPVVTQDEFGIIAQKTNMLINELREKQKIQKTLERIVSPDVMQKLMESDSSVLKSGERKHVAIFFCDLRKYTLYAEKTPAEDVIFFLNAYFTKVVDIVSEYNGIVNKFMGDAILAVFPLDNNVSTIENAVSAALDIIEHSHMIRLDNDEQFNVGIGIHTGYATAGTIGSQDRFEYTFIGDTVNTASRLDGLSKRLEYSLIISENTYEYLGNSKKYFTDLGVHKIRGKNKPVHVYGAAKFNGQNQLKNLAESE